MSKTPSYESVIAEMRHRFLVHAEDRFDFQVDPMTSPIEKVFVATMITGVWTPVADIGLEEAEAVFDTIRDARLSQEDCNNWLEDPQRVFALAGGLACCATQHWLELPERRIRPDFAFILPGKHGCKIIVELDGHDFHERTPEQSQSDKSRDRELQTLGWHVMRFTGREVSGSRMNAWRRCRGSYSQSLPFTERDNGR